MNTQRQLAAIMFTDIVGYTALMGKNSEQAMQLVKVSMRMQKPLVKKHHGKWLKEMGDGAMAQFGSALDAVNCALEIQRASREGLDADIRIGIHSGDITIEDNDIYGDGVNVASRLESIADPGGIYISDSVLKSIQGQTDIQTKDLGEVQLKNVAYKVRIYAVQGDDFPTPDLDKFASPMAVRRNPWVILAAAILVAAIGVYVYFTYIPNNSKNSGINGEVSMVGKSIAVLPFENRSKLEDDVYFTDGVHDDLLTQISKIREIKTISRTSVLTYRNTTKNMRTIGEELGVATILEGGVQRAGNQIRINVQLIDAKTDTHLWAETYTRELSAENIFTIQSEIAQAIASALATILSPQEKKDLEKLPTQNLAALEAWFQAKGSISKSTNQGYQEAIEHLNLAIKLDNTFAIAYAELGRLHLGQIYWEGLPVEEQINRAQPLIERALELDNKLSEAYLALGELKAHNGYSKQAQAAYQKAIELNPNNATAYSIYGNRSIWSNLPKAIELLFKAKELDPKDDAIGIELAYALIFAGRFEESKQIVKEIISRKPDYARAYSILSSNQFYGDAQLAESMRTIYENIKLDPGIPGNSMLMGFAYNHTGDTELAIQWFDHTLLLAPESSIAEMIQTMIYELRKEYHKAVDTYLKMPKSPTTAYRLFRVGLKANRSAEVFKYFQKNYPELFKPGVQINKSNFTSALVLGHLLKTNGERDQADHLLRESLKVAQAGIYGPWNGRHNNWETHIHLAMGNNQKALVSFDRIVADGYHLNQFLTDPIYQPLYDDPEYQRIITIVKTALKEERAKLREMEANGILAIPPLPDK
jgi:TolB-like protein/class 3 adenylate cyclase/Flp pilus assembly protein TadD